MPGPAPAALTVPGRLRRSVGGEAAMGGALCWTIRHLSLHPGPPPLLSGCVRRLALQGGS